MLAVTPVLALIGHQITRGDLERFGQFRMVRGRASWPPSRRAMVTGEMPARAASSRCERAASARQRTRPGNLTTDGAAIVAECMRRSVAAVSLAGPCGCASGTRAV